MPIYLLYSLGINSIHSTYDKGRCDVPITYVFIRVIVDRINGPFVLFLLAIVLSVLLRYTVSDCPFGIFKLFLR